MSLLNIKNEWIKQPVDQTLHAIWGFVPWWLALTFAYDAWMGFPLAMVPGISSGIFLWREMAQYPSKRRWDPPLDIAVFIAASGAGIWAGLR